MRFGKLLLILIAIIVSSCSSGKDGDSQSPSSNIEDITNNGTTEQPPVYLTIVSHSEEPLLGAPPPYIDNRETYLERRALLKTLVETIRSRGAAYNFQSDWPFLEAARIYDDENVVSDTSGKNIVRWMKEDQGVEVEPHAHETQYNYADVAYLYELLGITSSKTVGGFLYGSDDYQDWEKHKEGIYGWIFPDYFWQAEYLVGAATLFHEGADDTSSGIWRPKDAYNFFEDDPNQRLIYIGGCTWDEYGLQALLNAIEAGSASSDGFYTAVIFMDQDLMTEEDIVNLGDFIDSLSDEVESGRVRWATFSEMVNTWKAQYGEKAFRYDCPTS